MARNGVLREGSRTDGYRPSFGSALGVNMLWDEDGWFSRNDIFTMLLDPMVQFILATIYAPVVSATWKVEAKDARVAAFVDKTLRHFWGRDLYKALRMLPWGSSGGEVLYELDEDSGLWEYTGLKEFHVADMTPMQLRGKLWGLRIRGVPGTVKVDLPVPSCLWFANDPQFGRFHGESRLLGMWKPWKEKRGKKGAIDVRRNWFIRCCFRGPMMRYPAGDTQVSDDGKMIPNQDFARELIEKAESGFVQALPGDVDPESGKYLWEWIESNAPAPPAELLEWIGTLDKEMLQGGHVPPEVVQAADTGSGWSGRSVPFLVFLNGEDRIVDGIIHTFRKQVVDQLVGVNFGPGQQYEVKPVSLVPKDEGGAPEKGQKPPAQKPEGEGEPGKQPGGMRPQPEQLMGGATEQARKSTVQMSAEHDVSGEARDESGKWTEGGGGGNRMGQGTSEPEHLRRTEDEPIASWSKESNTFNPETKSYAADWVKVASKNNKFKRTTVVTSHWYGPNHVAVAGGPSDLQNQQRLKLFLQEALGRKVEPYREGWQVTVEEATWLGLSYSGNGGWDTVADMLKTIGKRSDGKNEEKPSVQMSETVVDPDTDRGERESVLAPVDAIIDRAAAAGQAISEEVREQVRAAVRRKVAEWRERLGGELFPVALSTDATGHEHDPHSGRFTGHGYSAAELAEMSHGQRKILAARMGMNAKGKSDEEIHTAPRPKEKVAEVPAIPQVEKLPKEQHAAAVKELLAATQKAEKEGGADPRGDLAHLPQGERLDRARSLVAEVVGQHVARTSVGMGVADLQATLKAKGLDLKPEEFRAVLLDLHGSGDNRLSGWSRMPDDLPRPDLAPVVAGKVMGWVSGKKSAQLSTDAGDHRTGDPDPDDGKALAEWYADTWNLLTEAGAPPDDDALEAADNELDGGEWLLDYDDKAGKWAVKRDPGEGGVQMSAERSPKGGVTINGKRYAGGQWIPGSAVAAAPPEVKKKLEEAKAGHETARRARGSVDVAALRRRLAGHAEGVTLDRAAQTSAKRAFAALHRSHGELTLHRLEELADQLETALAAVPEDETGIRAQLRERLASLHSIMGHAEGRGVTGQVSPEDAAAAQAAEAARPKPEPKAKKAPAIVPGQVYNLPTHALHVDPERFQYKLNVNKAGVTDELLGVKTWNPDFAGVISVWRDPENGETYVVNGHHRHELASRLGAENLAVRYVQAKTPKEARAVGALINIAEGRGTAVDAAKFMRDMGVSPDEMAQHGVSLKGKLAQDAATFTRLNDKLFDRVVRGTMDSVKALAIAKHLTDSSLQDQLAKILDKREDEGKDLSPKVIEEMAREMADTPTTTRKEEGGLFGDWESEDSLFVERAELKAHVRGEFVREVSDFLAVASKRRAAKVGKAGNVIDPEANREIARQADAVRTVYDRLVNRKGEISDAVNVAAEDLAKAKTKKARDAARARAVESVREAVFREAGVGAAEPGAEGGGVGGGGKADQGGPAPAAASPADAGGGGTEPAGLTAPERATTPPPPAVPAKDYPDLAAAQPQASASGGALTAAEVERRAAQARRRGRRVAPPGVRPPAGRGSQRGRAAGRAVQPGGIPQRQPQRPPPPLRLGNESPAKLRPRHRRASGVLPANE